MKRDHPFYLFAMLILLAPLPLGSNRSWALWLLMPFVALIWISIAHCAERRQRLAGALQAARLPLFLFGTVIAIQLLQLTPLPDTLHALLSPKTYDIWSMLRSDPTTISLDPSNTRIYLAFSLIYLSAFCFVLYFGQGQDNELLKLAYILVGSAFFQSLLGIFLFSISARYEIFHFSIFHNRTFGTFSYHNHLAGYLEMCLSIGLGLIVAQLGQQEGRPSWKKLLLDLLHFIDSPKMKLRLALVVIVIALVLTRSRMGNAGFFAALLLATVIYMIASRKINRSLLILVTSMLIIDIFVVGTWVGIDKVAERIENTRFYADATHDPRAGERQESVEERLLPASSTVPMMKDFLWFGSGAGTFYFAFTPYKPADVQANYDHAHNDYVELMTDFGMIGFTSLAGIVLLVIARVLKAIKTRRSIAAKGMALGSLMAIICIVIHSVVDFNLQLPNNALSFTIVLAIGWAALTTPHHVKRDKP